MASHDQPPRPKPSELKPMPRRQAIQGLGALALMGKALASSGCDDEADPLSGGDAAGATTGSPEIPGGAGAGLGRPSFFPPNFERATNCALTPTDFAGEGPFFIHEDEKLMNEPSLRRSDLRDGRPGVELQLHLRMLDTADGCTSPIPNTEVYVWHTDALGYYSGFNGQDPDRPYSGVFERVVQNTDRFCRGVQVTDADGVVSFRTLYPGWYSGRPIHIHFVALRPGSTPDTGSYRSARYMMFTTQMYFEEAFSRRIHENYAPYTSRISSGAYNTYMRPGSSVRAAARMEGDIAVASLNILTDSEGSRVRGGGLFGL